MNHAERIVAGVCAHYRLPQSALTGGRGPSEVQQARHVAFYLLQEDAHMGPCAAGRRLKRGHQPAIHSHRLVSKRLDAQTDPAMSAAVRWVRAWVTAQDRPLPRFPVEAIDGATICKALRVEVQHVARA